MPLLAGREKALISKQTEGGALVRGQSDTQGRLADRGTVNSVDHGGVL